MNTAARFRTPAASTSQTANTGSDDDDTPLVNTMDPSFLRALLTETDARRNRKRRLLWCVCVCGELMRRGMRLGSCRGKVVSLCIAYSLLPDVT